MFPLKWLKRETQASESRGLGASLVVQRLSICSECRARRFSPLAGSEDPTCWGQLSPWATERDAQATDETRSDQTVLLKNLKSEKDEARPPHAAARVASHPDAASLPASGRDAAAEHIHLFHQLERPSSPRVSASRSRSWGPQCPRPRCPEDEGRRRVWVLVPGSGGTKRATKGRGAEL